jgi:ammonia channel protein AmtB
MFFAIRAVFGLRVSREEELRGLDDHEHNSEVYPGDVIGELAGAAGD